MTASELNRRAAYIAILGCVLAAWGSKIWLVSLFGNPTPFWDQWDAEAPLYKAYLEGTLRVDDFFKAHNEHRILFLRVFNLLLLELNGSWDPMLQMVVNAGLHAAAIALLLVMLSRMLTWPQAIATALFAALILAVPFGWQNTLWGFQIALSLFLLLTFASILLMSNSRAFSMRWWVASALVVASYFGWAAAALTPLAFAAVQSAQMWVGTRSGKREIAGIGVQLLLAALLFAIIPTIPHHADLKPKSLHAFLSAVLLFASWPLRPSLISAVALNLPVLLLGFHLIRRRSPPDDPKWAVLALACWYALQCFSLAFGRGASMQSRYLDLMVVGLITNFAALLWLLDGAISAKLPKLRMAAAALWIVAMTGAAGMEGLYGVPPGVMTRYEGARKQTASLQNFLKSGDLNDLKGRRIPFPSAEYLRDIVSDPTVQRILPPHLQIGLAAKASGQAEGVVARSLASAKGVTLRYGPKAFFVGFGLLLWAVVCIALPLRSRDRTNDCRPACEPDA